MDTEDDDDDGYRKPQPWPLWVAIGLWGLPGRGWAWGFFWFSIVIAIGCTVAGFFFWPFFAGSGFVFAALWYFAAIRWVDQHGVWP